MIPAYEIPFALYCAVPDAHRAQDLVGKRRQAYSTQIYADARPAKAAGLPSGALVSSRGGQPIAGQMQGSVSGHP